MIKHYLILDLVEDSSLEALQVKRKTNQCDFFIDNYYVIS